MGQPAPNAALSEDELYYTDMPVGEILRRTRLHYGQSLADIETALRIRAVQLEAIEEGTVEQLPGRVYAIGFVRSYAEYLGLDGNRIVYLFKTQAGRKTVKPELHFPATASDSKIPPVWLVAVSVAVALVIVAGWWMIKSGDRPVVTEVPEVSVDLQKDIQGEMYGPFLPEQGLDMEEPAIAAQIQEGIILNITQNSWVEIKDKEGNLIVSQVLQAGDQYFVPDRPDLTMSLGNAGGVQLEVDGQPLSPVGNPGEILKGVPLDVEYLKQKYLQESE